MKPLAAKEWNIVIQALSNIKMLQSITLEIGADRFNIIEQFINEEFQSVYDDWTNRELALVNQKIDNLNAMIVDNDKKIAKSISARGGYCEYEQKPYSTIRRELELKATEYSYELESLVESKRWLEGPEYVDTKK